jgi:hypothetical protein
MKEGSCSDAAGLEQQDIMDCRPDAAGLEQQNVMECRPDVAGLEQQNIMDCRPDALAAGLVQQEGGPDVLVEQQEGGPPDVLAAGLELSCSPDVIAVGLELGCSPDVIEQQKGGPPDALAAGLELGCSPDVIEQQEGGPDALAAGLELGCSPDVIEHQESGPDALAAGLELACSPDVLAVGLELGCSPDVLEQQWPPDVLEQENIMNAASSLTALAAGFDTPDELVAAGSEQEDITSNGLKHHVLAIGGIWGDRPGKAVHSDTVRFNAVKDRLPARWRVFGISSGPHVTSTDSTLNGDLRHEDVWCNSSRRQRGDTVVDTITARGATVFVLDYYFIPTSYLYSPRYRPIMGYGNQWFARLIPIFIEHSGLIILLPNDKNGLIRAMHTDSPSPSLSVSLLTKREASMYHPLYSATDAITNFATNELRGTGASAGREKTNASQLHIYSNTDHPFFLIYKTASFASIAEVYALLRELTGGKDT